MLKVGLTGGIGSGKSTVSAMLARRGAAIVDADAITHELQRPGTDVLAAMVERFGTGILAGDGTLVRPAVADIVFSDPDALADLNGIVHPAVRAEIDSRLAGLADTDRVVVLDVPLLVENGATDLAALVVVDVDPGVAVERLVAQRGMRAQDARARIARQASREERLSKADVVIDNSGDLDALERRVDEVWRWIRDQEPARPDAVP